VSWSAGDPAREPTDLDTFAHSLVLPENERERVVLSAPLLIDVARLNLDLTGVPDFVPHSEVEVPTLAVGAERGLVTTTDGFSSYTTLRASSFFSGYVVPGFAHLDLLTARENLLVPLIGPLVGWVDGSSRMGTV
jgi:hypothetical protein